MVEAGTLRQGVWNDEDEGRHIACLLGASSPDVNDVKEVNCVALCMPQWLAKLTLPMFDGVPINQADAYALRYADVAERWCVLTPEAWDRVSVTFRVACIEQALAAAEAVQPTPRPDYWDAVQTACGKMVVALKSGDAAEAAEAAEAAREAAREAWAATGAATRAAWATWAAARAEAVVAAEAAEAAEAAAWDEAAEAAAWAARAAARAAREADEAAWAATGAAARAEAAEAEAEAAREAAREAAEAAYTRLFDVLLDAITAEAVLAADMKETTP
jgi:hypothetical protein